METPDPMEVMIVEDEPITRRLMGEVLRRSGYHPIIADSAETAIQRLWGGASPRVAIVDLDMPGMSGLEFISRLNRLRPWVKTILLTAADSARVRTRLETVTHPDHEIRFRHLRKPLVLEALLPLIDELITPANPPVPGTSRLAALGPSKAASAEGDPRDALRPPGDQRERYVRVE